MALTLFGTSRPLSIALQLAQMPPDTVVDLDGVGPIAVAKWRSRRFVDDSLIVSKGSRGRTSWINKEGFFVRELDASNRLGKIFFVCRDCDDRGVLQRLYDGRATTSSIEHLCNAHNKRASTDDDTASTASDTAGPPAKRQRRLVGVVEKQRLEELALGYIVSSDSPFEAFNNPFLVALLSRMNADLLSTLALSARTMRKCLESSFASKKQQIREELAAALTQVHLAFDLWTSPNGHAILGVSAHFISSEGKPTQRLLALSEQRGHHSGDAIGLTLAAIVRDWGLTKKVGVLVLDNATSNDRAGEALYAHISPQFNAVDVQHRRIRCYGHILNLVGRAFLYGEDNDSLEQESQVYESMGDVSSELRLWRRKGPVGKLHNIVKWVRASPQRSQYFKDCVSQAVDDGDTFLLHEQTTFELQLIQNNDTRWNSTYLMIERAMQKQAQIMSFLNTNASEVDPQKRLPDEDIMDYEDWRLLAEMTDILKPLYKQTLRTQGLAASGSHGALWEVASGVEFLLEKMEAWKTLFDEDDDGITNDDDGITPPSPEGPQTRYRAPAPAPTPARARARGRRCRRSTDPAVVESARRLEDMNEESRRYFRLSVTNGWKKLDMYYKKLEESPLYAAAIILHPRYGFEWLEDHWNEDDDQRQWVRDAREATRQYWKRWYEPRDAALPTSSTAVPISTGTSHRPSEFDDWMGASRAREPKVKLEIDRFLEMRPSPVENPVKWWLSHREEFPTVSQFALDIFAIPAMSADCERAFSLSKLTLTSQRLSMSPKTLEHLQCLKNWLMRGAVSLGTAPEIPSLVSTPSTGHRMPLEPDS